MKGQSRCIISALVLLQITTSADSKSVNEENNDQYKNIDNQPSEIIQMKNDASILSNSSRENMQPQNPRGFYSIQIKPAWFFSVQYCPVIGNQSNETVSNEAANVNSLFNQNLFPNVYPQSSYNPQSYYNHQSDYNHQSYYNPQSDYNPQSYNNPFVRNTQLFENKNKDNKELKNNTQVEQNISMDTNSIRKGRTKRSVDQNFNHLIDETEFTEQWSPEKKVCKKSIILPCVLKAKILFKKFLHMLKKNIMYQKMLL